MAGLAATVWIPTFAGMTGDEEGARASPPAKPRLRVTLTLALSHKGRGDPLATLNAWFRGDGLFAAPSLRAFALNFPLTPCVLGNVCGRDARAPKVVYRVRFQRAERLGDAGLANQANHPKSGMNSSQRIPSPFMGEG